jgi:hypothetical protein
MISKVKFSKIILSVSIVIAYLSLGNGAYAFSVADLKNKVTGGFSCQSKCTKLAGSRANGVFDGALKDMHVDKITVTNKDIKPAALSFVKCMGCNVATIRNFLCNALNSLKGDESELKLKTKKLAYLVVKNNPNSISKFLEKYTGDSFFSYCTKNISGGPSDDFGQVVPHFMEELAKDAETLKREIDNGGADEAQPSEEAAE